jgi:methionyl-tRNA formyltransferase
VRIFLIVDEIRIYHPEFVARFLRATPDQVVGAALITKVPKKNNIETYIRNHWYYLQPGEIGKLAVQRAAAAVMDKVRSLKNKKDRFYSVRSVLEHYNIDFFEVQNNINKPEYLDRMRAKAVDVIVSSNSLIFKKELLGLPSICCVNRHSALLPSYGGLWPVFQAFRSGEKYVGVTVHTMETKIDKGIVLAQTRICIEPGNTIADLYKKCFRVSSEVLLEALEKVSRNDFTPHPTDTQPSYFSFPTKEHWLEFRKRNGRFI